MAWLLFFKKDFYEPFQWIEFKCLNPVAPFQGLSLLLITMSLGVTGTLLIDLTLKLSSGFKTTNPGLVIGKHLIVSLLLHCSKAMYNRFKM